MVCRSVISFVAFYTLFGGDCLVWVIDWYNSSMVEEMRSLLPLKLAKSSLNHTERSHIHVVSEGPYHLNLVRRLED